MTAQGLKVVGLAISAISALIGLYFVAVFARSASPDRGMLIAPLFILGLPFTFFGNIAGFVLMMLWPTNLWAYALPVFAAYFLQWQAVAWWVFQRGR